MCVRVNSTPSILNVPQGCPRVSEQMTNVKPGYREKTHTQNCCTHEFICLLFSRMEVLDHIALRDWENEL